MFYFQDKRPAVYTVLPSLLFVQVEFYIQLLLIKEVAGTLIRGYNKDRKLCVILDLQIVLHSAPSWIYQVLVLFMTVINTNQET
jgi:hypothetical protein